MAKVEGLSRTIENLEGTLKRAKADAALRLVVGYKAEYAIFVHENLQARHVVGQAKFLEQPLRQLRPQLIQIVADDIAAGKGWRAALTRAGLFLQRASQKLTPVLTGFLRNSAYTKVS